MLCPQAMQARRTFRAALLRGAFWRKLRPAGARCCSSKFAKTKKAAAFSRAS